LASTLTSHTLIRHIDSILLSMKVRPMNQRTKWEMPLKPCYWTMIAITKRKTRHLL
jgi:hypothetical protein